MVTVKDRKGREWRFFLSVGMGDDPEYMRLVGYCPELRLAGWGHANPQVRDLQTDEVHPGFVFEGPREKTGIAVQLTDDGYAEIVRHEAGHRSEEAAVVYGQTYGFHDTPELPAAIEEMLWGKD